MLWKVRASSPDRPGGLAALAQCCAAAGADIRAMQVFPGVDEVTDEVVVDVPAVWGEADVAVLVESAGWRHVFSTPCTGAALTDQPTRYVEAARQVLAAPESFPEVVAALFDTEPDQGPGGDLLEMTVGDVLVQVRRATPFTDTERARGVAVAELVTDVLRRGRPEASLAAPVAGRRLGDGARPSYVVEGRVVSAVVSDVVVGRASLGLPGEPAADELEDGCLPLVLRVDPAWRRRGVGTRLLVAASRLALSLGAREVALSTTADNRAVLPLVLAAGMHGRIRLASDQLTVRVPVQGLRPLEVGSASV